MLKNLFSIILMVGFIVSTISSTNAAITHREPLIGAQISILEGDDWRLCEDYFHALKELGYNTIILRVFHNRGDRFHNLIKIESRKKS